jgi:hypothetical protein
MSPYFHYARSACGIPRVKILGTKEDWQSLERKIHLLATEVFAQDISMEKSLSTYLSRVETVVRRIHTSRDPKFWERMFAISRCHSGHTDMVTGWISLLYKNGNGDIDRGCCGNDYYNYDSHISTVSWKCHETSKEFELRTGLLYSVINEGKDELDRKFPWFEPQFGHVVFDKNFKMTADQFQQYIDTTLKNYDKRLFQHFFEVLKDDPMIIDKGPNELKQRLEIARRQLEYWKKNCKDMTMDELDLENSDFGDLINQSAEDKDKPVIEKFIKQLVEFLQTMKIPKIVMASSGVYEKELLRALIGNEVVVHLSASCDNYETTDTMGELCELLAHPKCQVRTLIVNGQRLNSEDLNLLGKALMNTTAPIEHFQVTSVEGMELADAIYFFATKKNLKSFSIQYPNNHFDDDNEGQIDVMKRLYGAIRDSRSLEEVKISYFGDRRIDTKSYKTYPMDVTDLYDEVAENLKLNSNLKELTIEKWMYSHELLTKMLSVPSLQRIKFVSCEGFIPLEFLDVTKNLESIGGGLKLTTSSAEKLSRFLADPQCKLNTLNIDTKFDEETLHIFINGFINNKSLTSLNLDSVGFGDTNFFETILAAIKNGAPIQDLSLSYTSKSSEDLEQLLIGLVAIGYKNLRRFVTNLPIITEAGFNAVLQIIHLNQSLIEFEVDFYGWGGKQLLMLTEDQENLLCSATKTLPNLEKFGVNGFCKQAPN